MTAMSSVFAGAEEWTVEAGRPDTASEDVLALLRRSGVTRISVNPQTMQQRLLDASDGGTRQKIYIACTSDADKWPFPSSIWTLLPVFPAKPQRICGKIWKLFANCTQKMLQFIR